jgi:hypothetical protein
MSRDHHFGDVVGGGEASPSGGVEAVQGSQPECDAKCASIATQNATPQASASGRTESHKTTEPAATIQVAAGSSGIAPVTKTDLRQDAAQKNSKPGPEWPGLLGSGGDRIRTNAVSFGKTGGRVQVRRRMRRIFARSHRVARPGGGPGGRNEYPGGSAGGCPGTRGRWSDAGQRWLKTRKSGLGKALAGSYSPSVTRRFMKWTRSTVRFPEIRHRPRVSAAWR